MYKQDKGGLGINTETLFSISGDQGREWFVIL